MSITAIASTAVALVSNNTFLMISRQDTTTKLHRDLTILPKNVILVLTLPRIALIPIHIKNAINGTVNMYTKILNICSIGFWFRAKSYVKEM
jgi:hypothetical protein